MQVPPLRHGSLKQTSGTQSVDSHQTALEYALLAILGGKKNLQRSPFRHIDLAMFYHIHMNIMGFFWCFFLLLTRNQRRTQNHVAAWQKQKLKTFIWFVRTPIKSYIEINTPHGKSLDKKSLFRNHSLFHFLYNQNIALRA